MLEGYSETVSGNPSCAFKVGSYGWKEKRRQDFYHFSENVQIWTSIQNYYDNIEGRELRFSAFYFSFTYA